MIYPYNKLHLDLPNVGTKRYTIVLLVKVAEVLIYIDDHFILVDSE
jgi:hypothetical protein